MNNIYEVLPDIYISNLNIDKQIINNLKIKNIIKIANIVNHIELLEYAKKIHKYVSHEESVLIISNDVIQLLPSIILTYMKKYASISILDGIKILKSKNENILKPYLKFDTELLKI